MSKNLSKAVVIISSLLLLAGCGEPAAPGKYAAVAKCLTEKGVIMYGAYWCPHCANQKKAFGSDVQFIKYQECDPKGAGGDKELCLKAGVSNFPTWGFPGQGNLVGEQTIPDLAKMANCSDQLPADEQEKLKEAEAAKDKSPLSIEATSVVSKPLNVTSSTGPATK